MKISKKEKPGREVKAKGRAERRIFRRENLERMV
jgi:hypothetical protein